jgi:hypothetical protein
MSSFQNVTRILAAIDTATGNKIEPDSQGYCTLPAGTYVFVFPVTLGALLESIHLVTDASLVASGITIETSNAMRNTDGVSAAAAHPSSISDYDVASTGFWVPENPSGATSSTTGTGWGGSGLALTKTAGVGGAIMHLGNFAAARMRSKVVVTTQGKIAAMAFAKA